MFSSLVSCVVVVFMMFQFWNEKYEKRYRNRYLYKVLAFVYVISVMFVNTLMNPFLNLSANMVMIGIVSIFFYEEKDTRRLIRIFESAAFFTILSVTEAVGVYFIDFLMKILGITPEIPELLQSIEYTFSKIVMLFLYYVFFVKLWRKRLLRSRSQYFLYMAMFLYGVVNVLATAAVSGEEHPAVLMIVMGSIVFSNMFLLYFMKYLDERNFYKLQIDMMQQQERLRYENYEIQKDTYIKSLSVLHDVKKHIAMIEALYQEDREKALHYTRQINDMLKPLAPMKFVNNPVLNCLLVDKTRLADQLGIQFVMDVSTADIDFMEPIDITTLFGNLLDNAVTACRKCENEKYIGLFMQRHGDMLFICIENSICEPVPVRDGRIAESKSGIGTLNIRKCVDAYHGTVHYKNNKEAARFICEILLNMKR